MILEGKTDYSLTIRKEAYILFSVKIICLFFYTFLFLLHIFSHSQITILTSHMLPVFITFSPWRKHQTSHENQQTMFYQVGDRIKILSLLQSATSIGNRIWKFSSFTRDRFWTYHFGHHSHIKLYNCQLHTRDLVQR